jgi:hypothetical protein
VSAPKAGTYVLTSSAFYRVEGEGDEAVRKRYKRGDRVELSKAEAARLAVPTRLAPAAFVSAGQVGDDEVTPGADLATAPAVVVPHPSQVEGIVAEANTGLFTGEPVTLTEEQAADNEAVADYPAVTGAAPVVPGSAEDLERQAATAPTAADGKPAKSATIDAWREYAVKVEAVSADEAADLNKAALQEAVARKVG